MRAERWWQETSVIDQLYQRPTAFELVQATRLLRHDPQQQNQQNGIILLFLSSLNLNFPVSEIESLQLDDERVQITNLMVGLTGIQGYYLIPTPIKSDMQYANSVNKVCIFRAV